MAQFHVQLPPSEMYPEDSLEFFDTFDEVESYAFHLLENIFNGEEEAEPVQEGFVVFQGTEYVASVVRLPTGKLFCFREPTC